MLRIGPGKAYSVSGGITSDIRKRYCDLFNGDGLLKAYKMKLLIDESVKPVAQRVPRIACRLREKVNKKDDELLELDIINRKYQRDHLVRWKSFYMT